MSARHRHHKRLLSEAERDLVENGLNQEATDRVMDYLLNHGHDKMGIAYHTLEHVLANLEHDRNELIEVIKVLAPDDWRWRVR